MLKLNMNQNKNDFVITLLSVLLLISVFIAGFFAYRTQNLVKEIIKLRITASPTITSIPSPKVPTETPISTDSASPKSTMVACTMDAKLCDDGSYVGRSGPKCEFTACPTPKS